MGKKKKNRHFSFRIFDTYLDIMYIYTLEQLLYILQSCMYLYMNADGMVLKISTSFCSPRIIIYLNARILLCIIVYEHIVQKATTADNNTLKKQFSYIFISFIFKINDMLWLEFSFIGILPRSCLSGINGITIQSRKMTGKIIKFCIWEQNWYMYLRISQICIDNFLKQSLHR